MNSISFKKNLLSVQEELLRFAYKLTADREEANDLLQETSLKALDMRISIFPIQTLRDGCTQSCVTSLLIITEKLYVTKHLSTTPITYTT